MPHDEPSVDGEPQPETGHELPRGEYVAVARVSVHVDEPMTTRVFGFGRWLVERVGISSRAARSDARKLDAYAVMTGPIEMDEDARCRAEELRGPRRRPLPARALPIERD